MIFIFIIIFSIWILYNHFTIIFPQLYYLDLYHGGNVLVEMIHLISIRWSFPIGLILLAIGVLGLIFGKMESNNFSGIKYPALIASIIFSIALLL